MSNSPAQKVMLISGHPEGAALPEKPPMREVFEQEEGGLVRFAFGLVGRREVAEELVQEGFFGSL